MVKRFVAIKLSLRNNTLPVKSLYARKPSIRNNTPTVKTGILEN